MDLEKINVSYLLQEVTSTFYDQLIEKNFKVTINIPDEVLYFNGDVASFERIFTNLIQNTLVYGTDIFEIFININRKNIIFRNKIADTQGFDVELLLNRFYTADKSRTDKSTGLGLAIVKELINSMGGTIKTYLEEDFLVIVIGLG